MLRLKQVKTLFFDFFGTLVEYQDTYTISFKTITLFLRKNNILIEKKLLQKTLISTFDDLENKARKSWNEYSMDDVMSSTFKKLFLDVDGKLKKKCIDIYLQEWNRFVIYDESVNKLLKDLAKVYPIAIITNTHHSPLINYHLRAMGMKSFSFPIVTSIELGRRKPCPTVYHHAAKLMGILPKNGLMVGDSLESDYYGSLNAGMQAVLLDKIGKNSNIHSISSLHDLRKMLL